MFFKKLFPAILWAAVIMVLCGIPGNKIPELNFLQWLKPDKIVHLLMFGTLCVLLLRAFRADEASPFLQINAVMLALIITISYGALTEILQTYVFIKRTGDVRDAMANALGAWMGWYFFSRKKKVKH
jgi:VanZ family protein